MCMLHKTITKFKARRINGLGTAKNENDFVSGIQKMKKLHLSTKSVIASLIDWGGFYRSEKKDNGFKNY